MSSFLSTVCTLEISTCYIVCAAVSILYSALGGLMAMKYVTWVQFGLIILGTTVLGIPLSINAAGGVSKIMELPPEFFSLGQAGFSSTLALALSSIFSFYTAMDSYMRCFAAKTEKAARNGTIFAGIAILFIAVGASSIGLAARVLIPELPADSSAYAALVITYFPVGISGIVFAGVFAAIMSTAVVSINAGSANVGIDIFKGYIKHDASDKSLRYLGIISSVLIGVLGAILAWWKRDILELLLISMTVLAASLFFPTVLGVLSKKPTEKAAFYSTAVSLLVVIAWVALGSINTSPIFKIDSLWPGLLVSGILLIGFTAVGKPTPADIDRADKFFSNMNVPAQQSSKTSN